MKFKPVLQSTSLLRGKTRVNTCQNIWKPGFNPLPSCEGRRQKITEVPLPRLLQSTSLLRGKTLYQRERRFSIVASIHFPFAREDAHIFEISDQAFDASIHFPLAREDPFGINSERLVECFNPLPSCEGRQKYVIFPREVGSFNPLPSCEGRQSHTPRHIHPGSLQSTSLLRGKTVCSDLFLLFVYCFNPLPSCEGRPESHRRGRYISLASIHFPLAREDGESLCR